MHGKEIHVVGVGGTLRARSTSLWALERALGAAREAGATTDLIPLRDQELPFFVPGRKLEAYPAQVRDYLDRLRRADAILLSSAGYHGTLAGVTKNALDFLEFLSGGERPYLHQRVVGLIATAGGDMAQVHTLDAMVHVAHSLRGTVAPLQVGIPYAHEVFERDGTIRVEKWAQRLDMLGALVVEQAGRMQDEPAFA